MPIRAMTPSDYDAMLALWQATPGIGLSDADSPQAITRFLQRNPGLCFVAEEGGQLAGTLLCGHDARRAYIYHLAVHPHFRRRGLGRALVERCFESLRALDIHKCHIFVYGQNEEGLAFWRSTGWTQRFELVILSKNS